MYQQRLQKFVLSDAPTSQQSHTALVDTMGFDFVSLGVHFSTVSATNGEITFKVEDCDTSNGTFSAVATGGTDFTAGTPPTSTTVAQDYQIDIDMRGRKRYLLLTITPFTTKTITTWVTLGAAEQSPTTASNLIGRVNA